MTTEAHLAVERAARDGYGRLVAWLASRGRDLAAAEDAVGDALEAALRTWPERGVPDRPEAWLLTVARRKVIDGSRRAERHDALVGALRIEAEEAASVPFRKTLPDRRLELMFACAHPEVPVGIRTPLILQAVLGLPAQRIAGAMLVAPSALSQRLVRAKRRLQEAAVPFELPPPEALEERLGYVLDAVYAAFGTGWEATGDAASAVSGLAQEALWIGRLLVGLLPEAAEAKGLYALMLHCEARRAARRTPDGAFVPLDEQDPARWDRTLQREAEKALWMASQLGRPGPYQLEAAIQSLHADRARTGRVDWAQVEGLYRELARTHPSLGASLGHAAALGRLGRVGEALERLDLLDPARVARHQPYWAVRAHLLDLARDRAAADAAYARAIGLTSDPAVRRWLEARRARGGAPPRGPRP